MHGALGRRSGKARSENKPTRNNERMSTSLEAEISEIYNKLAEILRSKGVPIEEHQPIILAPKSGPYNCAAAYLAGFANDADEEGPNPTEENADASAPPSEATMG